MDKVIIDIAEETQDGMDCEFVELGRASEDTKGGAWGPPDGGAGYCWC